MSSVACFVGLDYHQDSVQVCVLDQQGRPRLNRPCRNDWRAIVESVERIGVVRGVAIEACGGSANLAEQLREQAHWPVDLAHPGYVAKLKGSPDKSDFSDGRLLADLCRVGYVPRVWLASAYERDLRSLVVHRQSLIDERRALKLRVGALLREHRAVAPEHDVDGRKLGRWSARWMAWARTALQLSDQARWIIGEQLDQLPQINVRIRSVERRLREVTTADAKVAALQEEAGIGEVTAWIMRAFIGRFDRFANGKQLSRYCGLSPANASTGKRQADAGLIRGCNKLLRATLIQAGHRLIRTEPRWRELAQTMLKRGKPKCVVVAAVANRWMRGLWHRQREQAAGTD